MTELFNKCVKVILQNEGGYVNDPNDLGGETKYGISKRAFPDLDIKELTINQAKEIYYEKYWLSLHLEGLIEDNAALQIFDMGVNAGVRRAIKIAQKIVGEKCDGMMGPKTTMAINLDSDFVEQYKQARRNYYCSIVKKRNSMVKFLKGWLNRIDHTRI